MSPDGNMVYVTRAGDDTLAALARNSADGTLTAVDAAVDGQNGVDGLVGANAVAVSSDSKFVYVAAQFADAVAEFRTGAASCAGDCDGDGTVTVDELVRGVNIALGTLTIDLCRSFDTSGDGMVTVDELAAAVTNALNGCPA